MKKRVIALTMAALMAASLTACGGSAKETTAAAAADTTAAAKEESTAAESTAAESKEAAGGKLVMATNAEFPPYEFHDGDKIVGIDAEIAQAIADELGMELEIEDIAFDSIIPEIVSGKADMALAGMTVTEDRKASVDFSDTYATASQMIIVKEDSEIAGPDDLKGVTVGVQLGTTGDIYVSDLEADGTTVERYNKGFEAVQALSQGKIDAVVIDGEPAKTFVSETEGLKILDEAFTVEEYAIAVKKGNTELLDKVNGALETLKDNGTNPASAVQCGYTTVTCACDDKGNVDVEDLRAKAEEHKDELAALMITYPSTHGIFEPEIAEICKIIHKCGAQVYMDGANMNAQVGLTNPGTIGADVCHLNLHKTFASPHGGGGPGVGPVCVAEHLVPFLPGHSIFGNSTYEVSSAPYGSAGILPITYGYICMMGAEGLTRATKTAILSANYLAACFKDTYGIVYTGATGFVGHEMILDCRYLHEESGISENDIAKRLMDYGYHAPTLSFPVHGTLMIEPTESESLWELDNFVNVMQTIWQEIQEVKEGKADKEDNVLLNAPHPEYEVVANEWNHSYSREKAAYPIETVRENKFWINVARVDNTLGDRKLLPTRYGKFE